MYSRWVFVITHFVRPTSGTYGVAMPSCLAGFLRFPDMHSIIIVLRNVELQVYDRLEIELAKIVFGENRSE